MILPGALARNGWRIGLLADCATHPVTGEPDPVWLSAPRAHRLGQADHRSARKQPSTDGDPTRHQLANHTGQAPVHKSHRNHLDYTFALRDSPQLNAFALPGGSVPITRGLRTCRKTEKPLAGVPRDRIGHLTARHGSRGHGSARPLVGDRLSAR